MVSHETRRAVVNQYDPASPIIANRAIPSEWNSEMPPHLIRETSDDEHTDACGPASFADRREKRRLNRRAALQFIDTMAAIEGKLYSGPDEVEEDEDNTTASDDSFIVGDYIFD